MFKEKLLERLAVLQAAQAQANANANVLKGQLHEIELLLKEVDRIENSKIELVRDK